MNKNPVLLNDAEILKKKVFFLLKWMAAFQCNTFSGILIIFFIYAEYIYYRYYINMALNCNVNLIILIISYCDLFEYQRSVAIKYKILVEYDWHCF